MGDFSEFKPEPKVITDLLSLFSGHTTTLLPSSTPPSGYNPHPKLKSPAPPLLAFSSPDETLYIVFNGNRIDIARTPFNKVNHNNVHNEDATFKQDLDFILDKIFNKYNKKARRLALIKYFITREFSDEKVEKIFRNIFHVYEDNALPKRDWAMKTSTRTKHELKSGTEELNFIMNLSRGTLDQGRQAKLNRFYLYLDINTVPEATSERFNLSDVKDFYDNINQLHDQKISNFIKHIDK